jgi:hypothetical protein
VRSIAIKGEKSVMTNTIGRFGPSIPKDKAIPRVKLNMTARACDIVTMQHTCGERARKTAAPDDPKAAKRRFSVHGVGNKRMILEGAYNDYASYVDSASGKVVEANERAP